MVDSEERALLYMSFVLVSCLAYYLTLRMEVTCSSKMLVDFQLTTWCSVPEDRTLDPLLLLHMFSQCVTAFI
jgi:hypothetical protein